MSCTISEICFVLSICLCLIYKCIFQMLLIASNMIKWLNNSTNWDYFFTNYCCNVNVYFTPSSNVHYRNTTILIVNMKPWHVHFDSLLAYDVWTYKMYILIPWWNVFIFTHENTKNTSNWVSIWNDSNSKIAIKWLFLVIMHGLQW